MDSERSAPVKDQKRADAEDYRSSAIQNSADSDGIFLETSRALPKPFDLDRYSHLSRERLHFEARRLRQAHARTSTRSHDLSAHDLGDQELSLLLSLQLSEPLKTLQRSREISEAAVRDVANLQSEPLHIAGLVGAILERELWEFPGEAGAMIQNVALSRRLGVYFTPPHIAWYITARTLGPQLVDALSTAKPENVIDFLNIRILDPSCGCGIFLASAWRFLMDAYDFSSRIYPDIRQVLGTRRCFSERIAKNQLFGVEISARFSRMARATIGAISGVAPGDVRNIFHGDALLSTHHSEFLDSSASASDRGKYQFENWVNVMPSGGFDAVLLNPPYGRLRVLRSDYHEKSRASTLVGIRLEAALNERRAHLARLIAHFRMSDEFKATVTGVLDWQRLFIVRSLGLLKKRGRFGMIIPASILADRTSDKLRRRLLQECSLDRIDRLAETAKLFPGVNQPTCILVGETSGSTKTFVTTPAIREVPPQPENELILDVNQLRTLSESLPIPAASKHQFAILSCVHRFPKLAAHKGIVNARGEFDLTVYAEFMRSRGTRLVRGDHVERFQLRKPWESAKEGFVNRPEFERSLRGSSKVKHIDVPRLVGRQIAFLEKARRLSFVTVPKGSVVANSCNYLLFEGAGAQMWLKFLYGLFNSTLFEWRFRLTSSNNHVNNYEIDDFPVPLSPDLRIGSIANRLAIQANSMPFGSFCCPDSALENELDAAIFRLYGLNRKGIEEILGSIEPNRIPAVMKILDS